MKYYLLAGLSLAASLFISSDVYADKVCLKVLKNLKLQSRTVAANRRCPRGFQEVVNTATLRGPTGPTGPTGETGPAGATGETGAAGATGADGALRVWGDGSAGALNVTSSGAINALAQYTDIDIAEGVTATVPDGAILRCSGRAKIDGTITVSFGEISGVLARSSGNPVTVSGQGASRRAAGAPAFNILAGTFSINGGAGGVGSLGFFSDGSRAALLRPRPGGGGGAGHAGFNFPLPGPLGGRGGGAFGIYCQGGIRIGANGTIAANGEDGAFESESIAGTGGGAGGLVLLASAGEIEFLGSGVIQAHGGDGGAPSSVNAGGGGGAGGVVHLMAPTFTLGGSLTSRTVVTGGAGGSQSPVGTFSNEYGGGGGGGALVSNGGQGGSVGSDGSGSAGENGQDGIALQVTTADPTTRLLQ